MHLGDRLAGGYLVAALLEADDADRVVDLVALRGSARAEVERRDPDADRAEAPDDPATRSRDVADDGGARKQRFVGIAALRPDPALVSRGGRAVDDCLLGQPPTLRLLDAEVGEGEQPRRGDEDELREVGRPLAADRCQ